METVALKRSMTSNASYNQNRVMGRRSYPSYENVAPIIHGGQPPHPFSSSFNPSLFNHYMQQHLLLHQQPPLLPLPVSKPQLHQSLPSRTRSQSLTPKKPKSKTELPKKMNNNMNRLGPETNYRPKDVTMVGVGNNMDNFSSSIFILAPPPSSLPLPRFMMASAKGCKGEKGAGVDAGATDNLCRLMRLP